MGPPIPPPQGRRDSALLFSVAAGYTTPRAYFCKPAGVPAPLGRPRAAAGGVPLREEDHQQRHVQHVAAVVHDLTTQALTARVDQLRETGVRARGAHQPPPPQGEDATAP